jgi:hypothetical protein
MTSSVSVYTGYLGSRRSAVEESSSKACGQKEKAIICQGILRRLCFFPTTVQYL